MELLLLESIELEELLAEPLAFETESELEFKPFIFHTDAEEPLALETKLLAERLLLLSALLLRPPFEALL